MTAFFKHREDRLHLILYMFMAWTGGGLASNIQHTYGVWRGTLGTVGVYLALFVFVWALEYLRHWRPTQRTLTDYGGTP